MMHRDFRAAGAALLLAGVLLAGCSSSSDTPTLGGTAAAGAPLAGTVTVVGANGQSRTVNIAADGRYNVNRSGMTAPFLVRARGVVGSRSYDLVSTSIGGERANVTPLTDIIVGNVVGGPATDFFESPVPGVLTADAVSEQSQLLRTRLATFMDAVGVPANFDFMTGSFTANHTGHDAMLDLLDVTVDTGASTATIVSKVDGQQITDDLTDPSDATTLGVVDPVAVADAAAALPSLMQTAATISSVIASPDPLSPNVLPQLQTVISPDFLHGGLDAQDAVDFLSSDDPAAIFARRRLSDDFRLARLASITPNAAPTPGTPAEAEVEIHGGTVLFVDTGTGWQLVGDQSPFQGRVDSELVRFRTTSGTTYSTLLLIEAAIPGGSTNDYVLVQGPGLPGGQYVLDPTVDGISSAEIPLDAGAAGSIAAGSSYFFTRRLDVLGNTVIADGVIVSGGGDDTNVVTIERTLPLAPLLPEEPDFDFPTITAPTTTSLGNFTSGNLGVQWTRPTGFRSRWVALDRTGPGSSSLDALAFVNDNATSRTLTSIPAPAGGVDTQQVAVGLLDPSNRPITDVVEAGVID
jgi:hypothetical protein